MNESNVIGHAIIHLDSIESTNNYAELLCTNSTPNHGTVIKARFQQLGKGQIGRTWYSSYDKNILLSLILKPQYLSITQQFYLSIIVALSVRDTLKELMPNKNISIKWPNDIYVDHKKIAGILLQSVIMNKSIRHCIVGIGINVNEPVFPKEIPNPTSIFLETNQQWSIDEVLVLLLRKLNEGYSMLTAKMYDVLRQAYEKHLYLKDKKASFQLIENDNIFSGKITGVNEAGKLIMLIDDKEQHFIRNELRYLGNNKLETGE